jgi:C4-dicarboxylate-specific signal transduction histidine kinase
MLRSITAIHARSSGLLEFVQSYGSLSKLPQPRFSDVEVPALLDRVRTLMSRELDMQRITVECLCAQSGLRVSVDAQQIEHVLINLLRNAVEALETTPKPRIQLRSFRDHQNKVVVQVADNGPGIAREHLDSIFIPFFTTKRSGTGIGLSLSRQLMHANRGFISARSEPGEGTVFTLKFQ